MEDLSLHHVGVNVADLEVARRFLVDVLGFELEKSVTIPGRLEALQLRRGMIGVEIMIHPGEPAFHGTPDRQGVDHVALAVSDFDDTIASLRAKGVETTAEMPSTAAGYRAFFTRSATTGGIAFQLIEAVQKPAT